MPTFRYRALTQKGEVVSGSIAAANRAEVAQRIEYLGLVAIDADPEIETKGWSLSGALSRPGPAEVTIFTRDLALLLKAGARLNDALELLANDMDAGRLRPVISTRWPVRAAWIATWAVSESRTSPTMMTSGS